MPAIVNGRRDFTVADGMLLAVVMAAFVLQQYRVISSDPLLAWPITDQLAHPDRYSPDDLLVRAGATGNFLLYRLLAAFPFLRDNYPLRDFLFFVPLTYLLIVAWWKVFLQLGATRPVAAMAVIAVLFSDDKLALNWAHVAAPYFVSATSVQCLQVFGFLWFLRGRRFSALGLTAATGIFHPASALSLGAVYAVVLCRVAWQQADARALRPLLLYAALFLPTAAMVAVNSQGAFSATVEYFRAFEQYQPQAYLEDHFRMGYAYTLFAAAFLYRYLDHGGSGLRHRQEVFGFIGAGLALCVLWFINLYLIQNLQLVQTFFVMRIFSFIKPLLVLMIVLASVSLYRSASTLRDRAIAVLFLMTPLEFSPTMALVVAVSCAASAAGRRWWPLLCGALTAAFVVLAAAVHQTSLEAALAYVRNIGPGRESNGFVTLQLIILFAALALLAKARFRRDEAPRRGTSAGRHVPLAAIASYAIFVSLSGAYGRSMSGDLAWPTVFHFDRESYWGTRRALPAYAELLDWAARAPERLFAVPPYDDRFLSFRYLTAKGVYVFHRDIAQLMYSPAFYLPAVGRLVELGGDGAELRKAFMQGEVRRSNGTYESRCAELFTSPNFDAIIFPKARLPPASCLGLRPAFENRAYAVYRTAEVRDALARRARPDASR